MVSSLAAAGVRSAGIDVAVAVVERHEHHAGADAADAGAGLDRAAGRRDADQVALGDAERGGVGGVELDPHVGRGGVELRGAAGLGAGVELVDGPAGGEQQRVLVVGHLRRRLVVGGVQERPPARLLGPVLLAR